MINMLCGNTRTLNDTFRAGINLRGDFDQPSPDAAQGGRVHSEYPRQL